MIITKRKIPREKSTLVSMSHSFNRGTSGPFRAALANRSQPTHIYKKKDPARKVDPGVDEPVIQGSGRRGHQGSGRRSPTVHSLPSYIIILLYKKQESLPLDRKTLPTPSQS